MNWEYKTVNIKNKPSWSGGKFDESEINKTINELGVDGWELVSAVSANETLGDSRSIIVFFKREA